jgi:acyl-CoA reductase-like NAD-dependent aldehyde dehydrogenase
MSSSISRIQASNIDGRARTPRFIQAQLQALHSSLLVNVAEIRQAIASSTNHTPAEVGVEYHLAVSTVKDQYESINLDQVLEEEYKIANGKDASDRRVAKGVVYIVPASHTLFYSTIAPLSAAIAAGNCVVMEVNSTNIAFQALVITLDSWVLHFRASILSCANFFLKLSTATPSRSSIPVRKPQIS